ncbi:hypothetical protein KKG85_00050 [Patescibacteria group bacterium]|nr:hypothetical protein [Patescibacteria group bacterium]MBU2580031.1 hypothetical protein [Patescibacteria group bacterium]
MKNAQVVVKPAKSVVICGILSLFFIVFPLTVLASGTTEMIDSADKYAWSENLGWVNFGDSDGNVQVTDSGLTGYAWFENGGWLNLNPSEGGVSNTTGGILSGYAWGENTGWVNFNPTGGGVSIDTNGYFSGYAWGENTGWISFNCSDGDSCLTVDYKVKTDWVTIRCGNGVIEGSEGCDDGNTVSGDLCSAACVVEINAAGPPLPTNPPPTASLLINDGDVYASSVRVNLSLFAKNAIQMAISNSDDFSGISWEDYQTSKIWFLPEGDGAKTVYVIFRSAQGGVSKAISDSIILDISAPEKAAVIEPKDGQTIDNNTPLIRGTAEPNAKITITLDDFIVYQTMADVNGGWLYQIDTPLRDGKHWIKIKVQDAAGLMSEEIRIDFVIITKFAEAVEPSEKEEKWPFKPEVPEIPEVEKVEEEIPAEPYDLIPEEHRSKIPDILKRVSEQVRKIPQLPKFTFFEEIAKSLTDEFVKPVVFGFVGQTKKVVQAIFIQAPKLIVKKIASFYQMAKYQVKKIAILFNPPSMKEIVDLLPPIKKQISQVEKVEKVEEKELIKQEEIFFSSTHGSIKLSQTKEDKINLIAGVNVKAFIKPKPGETIKQIQGQLLFTGGLHGEAPNGLFPFKVAEAAVIQKAQAKDWLVGQYVFADDNQDGIYEAVIQIPPISGNYFFKTIIEYQEAPIKEIGTEMLIDPEGYVYAMAKVAGEFIEARLPRAKVTLFWLNPATYDWQIWSAHSYDQSNPQDTDKTGQYSFLVPEGTYYLKAERAGYANYVSAYFEASEGTPIHQNIELKPL